ncbi:MAG: Holliday junction resolvase RuvX [Mycoplasmatales bacterium]
MNRYMGIDYGSARIGISITDVLKIIASDFEVIKNTSVKESINRIKDICIEKKVELIVLGLPLNMDGTKGFQALEVEEFGNELLEVIDIKLVYMDERMSTKIAEGVMKEMKMSNEEISRKSDAKAASVILQDYIDYN